MSDSEQVFQIEEEGRSLILVPSGDHVGFPLAEMQSEAVMISQRLGETTLQNVIVDAGQTKYLSSSIIGALIQIWETVEEKGGRLVICNLTDDAMLALSATRLDTKWTCYDSRAEALAAVAAP